MYNSWEKTCEDILNNNLKDWKQHPEVYNMIEHLPDWMGANILKEIEKKDVDLNMLKEISSLNDRFGTKVYDYNYKGEQLRISPTSIRYTHQAIEIISMLQKKNVKVINFLEIGGGYGGLALIIIYLSKTKRFSIAIKKYIMYELNSVSKLQKMYLSQYDFIENTMEWKDSLTYGKDIDINDFFLISNYTLSTLDVDTKKKYLFNLLPKTNGCYMIWNSNNYEGLPFKRKELEEYPKTGDNNKIIII
jgi:hypothetical protein